jgi:hypothetical protein
MGLALRADPSGFNVEQALLIISNALAGLLLWATQENT